MRNIAAQRIICPWFTSQQIWDNCHIFIHMSFRVACSEVTLQHWSWTAAERKNDMLQTQKVRKAKLTPRNEEIPTQRQIKNRCHAAKARQRIAMKMQEQDSLIAELREQVQRLQEGSGPNPPATSSSGYNLVAVQRNIEFTSMPPEQMSWLDRTPCWSSIWGNVGLADWQGTQICACLMTSGEFRVCLDLSTQCCKVDVHTRLHRVAWPSGRANEQDWDFRYATCNWSDSHLIAGLKVLWKK